MTPEGWLTLSALAAMMIVLTTTRVSAELVMLAALTLLLTLDSIIPSLSIFSTPGEAFAGFANEGTLTVGVLFVVAAAIRETGGLNWIASRIMGSPTTIAGAQVRMMIPVAALSAFVNNTPLVAMMMPVLTDWSRRIGVPASKLLMPLSFAAILGGLCSIIGTSTNLVVFGLLLESTGQKIGLFEMTPVGLPCAIVGITYILLASRRLLPDRTPALTIQSDPREYSVEMLIEAGSPLGGQTVEQAGLRRLPGLYLADIDRSGEIIAAVAPNQRLEIGDRLVFVGVVESISELRRFRGLVPAADNAGDLRVPHASRMLFEAVVSDSCRLLGQTIRDGRFRNTYNAAVVAVARDGRRVRERIGDISLRRGDTLLVEAAPSFASVHRNSRDFYLVSGVADSAPARHDRARLAALIFVGMVVVAASGWLSILNAALLAAGAMVATRCLSWPVAQRCIDWRVLIMIGTGLGLGRALENSGAASVIADGAIGIAGSNRIVAIAAIYALTMLCTECLSNNAAATLMFPLAMATSRSLGVDHMPFVMAVMIAASCGFATPMGYQTHLMVYGPGGYRFSDFLRFGGVLNILVMITAVCAIALMYGW